MKSVLKKCMAWLLFSFKIIGIYIRYLYRSNKEVKIAISTTKGYADKTVPKLVSNLIKLKIDANAIYVFEGGHASNEYHFNKMHYYKVNHNSFDLTALIAIVELDIKGGYWLLLHDTLMLSNSFRFLFQGITLKGEDCLPLRYKKAMNIGFYNFNYLLQSKDYLLDFKNQDYSTEGLQIVKARAIKEEDYLFKNTNNKKLIFPELIVFEKSKVVKYFDKKRYEEHYPQLGIIKLKANYNITEDFIVTL